MIFTEDNSISIDELNDNEICYLEYEKHDDVIIEKAIKNEEGYLVTLKFNRVIKDYIAIYHLEGGCK